VHVNQSAKNFRFAWFVPWWQNLGPSEGHEGTGMADPRLEQLFRSLDATFSAAVGVEEIRAADDLALSFRQGLNVTDLLIRYPAHASVGDRTFGRISSIGADYLECESSASLVPMGMALIKIVPQGVHAIPSEETLVQRLRRSVRSSEAIRATVGAWDRSFEGRLTAAAADHIEIRRSDSRLVIPLAAICWISLGRGG
jgi:hypothetical protein